MSARWIVRSAAAPAGISLACSTSLPVAPASAAGRVHATKGSDPFVAFDQSTDRVGDLAAGAVAVPREANALHERADTALDGRGSDRHALDGTRAVDADDGA